MARTGKPARSSFWIPGTTREQPPKIILQSQRGTRIEGAHVCGECGVLERPTFRYARSNVGEVYLCLRCKGGVMEYSLRHVTKWIETNLKRGVPDED